MRSCAEHFLIMGHPTPATSKEAGKLSKKKGYRSFVAGGVQTSYGYGQE
jgi:hypothetical protein